MHFWCWKATPLHHNVTSATKLHKERDHNVLTTSNQRVFGATLWDVDKLYKDRNPHFCETPSDCLVLEKRQNGHR